MTNTSKRIRRIGQLASVAVSLAFGLSLSSMAAEPVALELSVGGAASRKSLPIRMTIVSKGQRAQWLPAKLIVGGTISCRLRTSDGTVLPYIGKKYTLKAFSRDEFVFLSPGHYFGAEVDLAPYFDLKDEATYTLTCEYTNRDTGFDAGIQAWTGTARSANMHVALQ